MFDFSADEEIIKDVVKKAEPYNHDKALCWSLACSTEPQEEGGLYFTFSHLTYKYCFDPDLENMHAYLDKQKECNPLSKHKQRDDGSCICVFPNKGTTCEECASGYEAVQTEIVDIN
jgi:hypothetical protein